MELEVRHVRLLLALAEELHFSRAAARLGIPQSALSQQVSRIERTLGTRLFDRTTRAVTLTDAARQLLPTARAIDADMRRLSESAGSVPRHARTLRIATFSSGAIEARLAEHIEERHPGLSVRHSVIPEDTGVPAFERGDFDVLLGLECPSRPFSFAHYQRVATVMEEPAWIRLPLYHRLTENPPVRLADLAKEIWVEYPEGTFEHDCLLAICGEAGFTPDIRYLTTDRMVTRDLLGRGRCIALTAPVTSALENCVMLPLDPVTIHRRVLAWNPGRCPEPVAQTIMTHMRQYCRDQARKNPAYWDEIVADPHRYRHLYPLAGVADDLDAG